jgi:phosphonopyruvate decarboxylase/sulfopyruvate decarboxylase subunit beta
MIRKEAIEIVSQIVGDNPIISANGFTSRDLFESFEKKSNFYMIGSMGLSSSIGLGIALKNLKKTVFVFDGDGNILMNLGSLATIGSIKPRNLIHIVFDNELHESTGSQPTISKKIQIDKLAKTLEYKTYKATTKKELENILNKIKKINGPILILIKISKSRQTSKRVNINPIKIKQRFMESLNQ